MMNIKIYKIFIATLLIIGFSSCNKWLDLKPQDGIVKDEFWKTKEHVESAVIGCYSSLLASTVRNERSMAELLFIYGEIRADMVTLGGFASIDELDISNVNILPSNSFSNWAPFYRIINYCNTVIDNAPEVLKSDPTLTQTDLDAFLSEALAIRAYMYFTLARVWGDVPLKLNATKSDADNFQIPTSPQLTILNQVASDLLLAESKARLTFGNNASDKGRFTKYSINAMQADVYLWLEDYDKAILACEKIEQSGLYGLVSGNNSWLNVLYATGNSQEGIFEFQFDQQQLNPFHDMFVRLQRYSASPNLMDDFYFVDATDETKFDIRGDRGSLAASSNLIYKYNAINRTQMKSLEESYTHWFLYRYADVMLMKAEALNEKGNGQAALDIIEEIRERAGAVLGSEMRASPDSKNEVSDYILAERSREFAFEGKRWFDLLRNAKRNNYERLDVLLDVVTLKAPGDKQQSIITKYKDFNSHYMPININELQTNKALVQNPFYK
jgi:hypothetical protein